MAASLAVLGAKPGRKIAVLGDMLELGDCAPAEHKKVGEIAAKNADIILAYGPNGCHVVSGAAGKDARCFSSREEMALALKQEAREGDVILFKGSRGMRLELVLDQFLDEKRD
jgi:UDP-N-acetylmuramoyl-tripeptide--D-alanyl-D-alanine ligase